MDRMNGYVVDNGERAQIATITPREAEPGEPYSATCWCGWGAEDTDPARAQTALETHRQDPQHDGGHNDPRIVWWV